MDDYPQKERRNDLKIDDIWKSIPEIHKDISGLKSDVLDVKSDVVDVKRTVSKHDSALFGYVDDHGRVYPGVAQVVQWVPGFANKVVWGMFAAFLTIMGALLVNFASHYYGWVH